MSNAYINFTFESKTDWVKKINECQKEIKRLKEENTILKQTMSNNSLLINENALLKSIIKEVREYIQIHIRIDDEYPDYMEMLLEEYNELLEILDKVGEEK